MDKDIAIASTKRLFEARAVIDSTQAFLLLLRRRPVDAHEYGRAARRLQVMINLFEDSEERHV